MTVYAGSLSGGSQIGPMIAGYLIEARGWRRFFILCAIIAAVDFVCTIFLLPETIYEPEEETVVLDQQEEEDIEKTSSPHHLETVRKTTSQTAGQRAQMDYGAYGKGLFSFGITKGAREKGVFKYITYLFMLPFPMLLVPGVLIASVMYGVILGG